MIADRDDELLRLIDERLLALGATPISDEELATAVAEIFFPDPAGWQQRLAALQQRVPGIDLEAMVLSVLERMARDQERANQIRITLPLPAPGGDDPLHQGEKATLIASQAAANQEPRTAPDVATDSSLAPAPTPPPSKNSLTIVAAMAMAGGASGACLIGAGRICRRTDCIAFVN